MPTHPNESIPEPWLSFLRESDAAAREEVRLDCMGGFVVTMVYGFSRPTGDLDVLEIAPAEVGRSMLELGMRGGALHRKYKIYLDQVGVAHVPEDYEDRLTEIFPGTFQHLRLLALDPYDLALSKLERNIQRDRDDVLHLARTVPLDLEILKAVEGRSLRCSASRDRATRRPIKSRRGNAIPPQTPIPRPWEDAMFRQSSRKASSHRQSHHPSSIAQPAD